MKKKKWDTPKLIVVARGKPQETVLTGCKTEFAASRLAAFVADYQCQGAPPNNYAYNMCGTCWVNVPS